MRLFMATLLSLTFALAGCSGLYAEPSTGMAHLSPMEAHAASILDEPVFFGMAAIEGEIDIDAFLEMAREELEEEGEDVSILDKFEFRFDNGALGDGRTGSWFGLFGEKEKEEILIVQSVAGGVRSHLISFEDDDDEYEAEAEMDDRLSFLEPLFGPLDKRRTTDESECDSMSSSVLAGIDSDRAASIAMDQELFFNHTVAVPEGDFIYVYVPALNFCWDGETDASPAMWAVVHADIDELLFNETEPEFAYVIINATDGKVIENDIEVPMEFTFKQISINVRGGALIPPLGPAAHSADGFKIPEGTLELSLYIFDYNGEMDHWVTDPSGAQVDLRYDGFALYVDLQDPMAGTWTIHSQFDHLPLEQRDAEASLLYYTKA